MEPAPTRSHTMADYEEVTDPEQLDRIDSRAGELEDTSVLHVNSTASGGGVAEMLGSLVPLLNDVGVETDWLVMEAPEAFFEVTKPLHNWLQGEELEVDEGMRETYRRWTTENAEALDETYDVVVLHDAQTLGMAPVLAERFPETTLVWRCHIDLTSATADALDFVRTYLDAVDRAVFSRQAYASELPLDPTVIRPSIDPLAPKNRPLEAAASVADDLPFAFADGPCLVQISRFDPWKDPLGVVEVYRQVRETFPDAQLVLAGGMADDDPEAVEVFRELRAEAEDDPGIYLLKNRSDEVVNLLQRRAEVVLQKSLREGFALTVSEALWKETPVVGANVGGIPLQIEDGVNGYLVDPDDLDAVADRVTHLLGDGDLCDEFGRRGREHVREHFLLLRQLVDYLDLFVELAGSGDA